jgi:NADH dehydrogenase FAD-containing subunit
MMVKKRVVIIGGGFAGTTVAKKLSNKFEATLIDSKDYFEYTPGVLRGIQDLAELKRLRVKHRDYLPNAEIVVGNVEEVGKKEVIVGKQKIGYDYLVIASGGKSRQFFNGPLVYSAYSGKDMENAFSKVQKAKKIVVVGGGLVGVELAAELAEAYRDKKISLVHPKDEILERQNPKTRKLATKWLRKHRVELVLGERIVAQEKMVCVCESGKKIEADVVFSCVGVGSNYEFLEKNFSKVLSERKQVIVDDNLAVKGLKNVFAVGDITGIKEEKTAQNAELQGEVVAENIGRLDNGEKLGDYKSGKRAMVVSLGSKEGILEYEGLVIGGFLGGLMKNLTEWYVMMGYR